MQQPTGIRLPAGTVFGQPALAERGIRLLDDACARLGWEMQALEALTSLGVESGFYGVAGWLGFLDTDRPFRLCLSGMLLVGTALLWFRGLRRRMTRIDALRAELWECEAALTTMSPIVACMN